MQNNINSQIESFLQNAELTNYFVSNDIDFVEFVSTYIKVDDILKHNKITPNELSNQMLDVKRVILEQSNQINGLNASVLQLTTQMPTILANLLNNVTNTDIRQLLQEQLGLFQKNTELSPDYLKQLFDHFHERIVNSHSKDLNDFDRKALDTISNMQSSLLNNFIGTLDSHAISHKINSIEGTLTALHNNFTNNSSNKGKMAENVLFTGLVKAFPDSEVILTSQIEDAGDIQISKDGKPNILIDSKHFESCNVPARDLEKFYENCKLHDSCGILCNTFNGIANKKHFEIDIVEKRVYVYITNHQFDSTLFQLAARIIYNIHSIIKEKSSNNNIDLDQQLYQRLKIEYGFFWHSFQQHLESIKSNINSLQHLGLGQLDQFFKRSNFNNELKPFSCHMCGTGCNSEKALKKHLKDKHDYITPNAVKQKGRKPKMEKTETSEMSE